MGVELISSSGVVSDYKILKIVSDILTTLNISNFFFRLNYIGNKSTRERYKKELEIFLNSNSEKLCNDCLTRKKKNSLRILDCNLCKKKINFPFYEIVFEEKEKKYLEKLKKYLEYDKIPYKFDYYLVRGLDYYTGLIFEVEVEDNIVLLGGGRYDHDQFFQEKREKKISSIGFAIGIDRVAEFCVKNKLLKINKGIDIFFLVLNEKRYFDIIAWRNFLKKKYTIDYNLEVVKKSKYPKIVKYFSPNLLIFLEEKKDEKLLKIKDCYNNKVFFVNEKEIVK